MFTIDSDMKITLSRGDSAALYITMTGDVPDYGDRVVASLKNAPGLKRCIWKKELQNAGDGSFLLEIFPEDTEDLAFGDYSWDVRVFYGDGSVTTLFNPAPFVISPVVTDNE